MAVITGQASFSTASTTSTLLFSIPPGNCFTTMLATATFHVTANGASTVATTSMVLPANVPISFRAWSGSAGASIYGQGPGTATVSWLLSTES